MNKNHGVSVSFIKTFLFISAFILFLLYNTNTIFAATTHTVTFKYGDKTKIEEVKHGMNAPLPTDTYLAGYTFIGWKGNANKVTEDRTILGTYAQNLNVPDINYYNYNSDYNKKINNSISAQIPNINNLPKGEPGKTCAIYWYNGITGSIIRTDIINYGSSAVDIPAPNMDGYRFKGWEGSWENVTEDRAIKAYYDKEYEVKFVDSLTGGAYSVQKVIEGQNANLPEPPHHEGYHLDYYDGSYTSVYSNRTITAYYEPDIYYIDDDDIYWW